MLIGKILTKNVVVENDDAGVVASKLVERMWLFVVTTIDMAVNEQA